jgi:hypothetical protein
MFYIDFTVHDEEEIIAEEKTLSEAITTAKAKQAELKADGKRGIITVYEDVGNNIHKTYEFFKV